MFLQQVLVIHTISSRYLFCSLKSGLRTNLFQSVLNGLRIGRISATMIVIDNEVSNSPTPSILDSPTLARVERARIRHESTSTYNSPLNHTMSSYCPVRVTLISVTSTNCLFLLLRVRRMCFTIGTYSCLSQIAKHAK